MTPNSGNKLLTTDEISSFVKAELEKASKGLTKKQKKQLLKMFATWCMWW